MISLLTLPTIGAAQESVPSLPLDYTFALLLPVLLPHIVHYRTRQSVQDNVLEGADRRDTGQEASMPCNPVVAVERLGLLGDM